MKNRSNDRLDREAQVHRNKMTARLAALSPTSKVQGHTARLLDQLMTTARRFGGKAR